MTGRLMEEEIREQPALLRQNVLPYEDAVKRVLGAARPEMVLLAARGSSDHAALYARYLIEIHLQIPVSLAAPSVLTRYGSHVHYRNSLAIGISQSGAAPDVAEILSTLREEGQQTLAITNTAGSKVSLSATHSLALQAGAERSVAATKTYTSSLLALYQLVRGLGGKLPDPSGFLPTSEWSETCRLAAEKSAARLTTLSPCFVLGRGYGFATANEGALKLMECALIPAKAYSTADFEHGPKALAGPGSAVVVYGESVSALENQGTSVLNAPTVPAEIPIQLHPIWQIFFGQWLALHCARARGLNPDRPQFIRKITRTT